MAGSFDVMALAPANPLMRMAWVDCLRWAVTEPGILDGFRADTGVKVAADVIGRMIDTQTGYDAVVARRFVEWFNETVWGDES